MSKVHKFDYAILGAGCAGLSLALEMSLQGVTKDKTVLLLDPDRKDNNDRTWSYWEKGSGRFDEITTHQWSRLDFASRHGVQNLDIHPYIYKMVRGIDYYNYVRSVIKSDPNIQWSYEKVRAVASSDSCVAIQSSTGDYTAGTVFKSYSDRVVSDSKALTTLQHFGGWYIDCEEDVWDSLRATFMDFRIDQVHGETRFCYVLPVSPRRALVEVAVYSTTPWSKDQYDAIIAKYIKTHVTRTTYTISEREYGVIPMSTYQFWKEDSSTIVHIGTAGGAVKPSSGYAFGRIHQHSRWIVDRIKRNKALQGTPFSSRYYHYDATLLHALLTQKLDSEEIFNRLFRRNRPETVLAFLSGETNWLQEIGLCSTMPILPFTKGLLHSLAS